MVGTHTWSGGTCELVEAPGVEPFAVSTRVYDDDGDLVFELPPRPLHGKGGVDIALVEAVAKIQKKAFTQGEQAGITEVGRMIRSLIGAAPKGGS